MWPRHSCRAIALVVWLLVVCGCVGAGPLLWQRAAARGCADVFATFLCVLCATTCLPVCVCVCACVCARVYVCACECVCVCVCMRARFWPLLWQSGAACVWVDLFVTSVQTPCATTCVCVCVRAFVSVSVCVCVLALGLGSGSLA